MIYDVTRHARLCGSLDVYLVKVKHSPDDPWPRWFVVQIVEGNAVRASHAVQGFDEGHGGSDELVMGYANDELSARAMFERLVDGPGDPG